MMNIARARFNACGGAPALLVAALALLLAGCGIRVDRPGASAPEVLTQAEFRAYTESVFRHHNEVQSRTMMLFADLEEEDEADFERLFEADEAMMEACRPLNRLVAEEAQNGVGLGFFERFGVPQRVVECDRRTREVEALLEEV